MSLLSITVAAMGLGRIAIGAAPFVAAAKTSRMLGFPAAHDTATARLMARFFGVRDIGLGVLAFYAAAHPELAPVMALFQATMDGGDLVSIAMSRGKGIDRAALLSAAFAATGMLAWLIVWAVSR
nr:DUF4267 domain-containing protein [Kofleriaceae bacterium]